MSRNWQISSQTAQLRNKVWLENNVFKYYVSYSKSLHNLELEHIFNKNRLKFSLIILIVSIACLSGKLMEICTSEPDSTAEKTKR